MARLWPDKARINARRIELGLSQAALSDKAKVGQTTIERILGPKPYRANGNTLKKLAAALGLTLSQIILKSPPTPVSRQLSQAGLSKHTGRYAGSDLPHGLSEYLIGREAELAQLNKAWEEKTTHLLSIIGMGGSGKTSLVSHWLAAGLPDYRGAESVFVWSFSGQGGLDAATDEFFIKAWDWFCPVRNMPNSWKQRAEHLAMSIAAGRHLLILDGLEVFQTPPGRNGGHIQSHEPLLNLLLYLVRHNRGLCIVTSRIGLEDLRAKYEQMAPQLALEPISESAGSTLLRKLGVNGTDADLASVVRELWGHPLTLNLLGRNLRQLDPFGDIRRWSHELLHQADEHTSGAAERIMAEYESWLGISPKGCVLHLLAMFDQPVDLDTLEIFIQAPAIAGLTDHLCEIREEDLIGALNGLRENGLINYAKTDSDLRFELHPMVRGYFRRSLQSAMPQAWRTAHARLFHYMLNTNALSPITYDEVVPLFQAIRHGCEAGLHAEVFEEVVWKRLMQGFPAYSLHRFNAGELDMLAVSRFFKNGQAKPNNSLVPQASSATTGKLYFWAGLVYRLHGRLTQAIDLFTHAELAYRHANNLVGEASAITYISRCQLQQGQVKQAMNMAQRAVDIVEKDLNEFAKQAFDAGNIGPVLRKVFGIAEKLSTKKYPIYRRVYHFPLADAMHHSGRVSEAQALFERAYQSKPSHSIRTWDLIAGQDAMYYDLLLTQGRLETLRSEVRKRLRLTPTESSILKPLMQTLLLRAEIQELRDPQRIPDIEKDLLYLGERLDYRCSYHTVRGLLELSAVARRCDDLMQAGGIIKQAQNLQQDHNLQLLDVEILIEQAALALDEGDTHTALSRAMQAESLVDQNGYELRREAIEALYVAAEQMELVTV